MKTTQEMIEVMQAYVEGKEIECKLNHAISEHDVWAGKLPLLWNWDRYDYRVKEEMRPWLDDKLIVHEIMQRIGQLQSAHDDLHGRMSTLEYCVHTIGIDPSKIRNGAV